MSVQANAQALIFATLIGDKCFPTPQLFNNEIEGLDLSDLESGEEIYSKAKFMAGNEPAEYALLLENLDAETVVDPSVEPRIDAFLQEFWSKERVKAVFDFQQNALIDANTSVEHLVEFEVENALKAFTSENPVSYIDPSLAPASLEEAAAALKEAIEGKEQPTEEAAEAEETPESDVVEETPESATEETDVEAEQTPVQAETGIAIPTAGTFLVNTDQYAAVLDNTVRAIGLVAQAAEAASQTNLVQAQTNLEHAKANNATVSAKANEVEEAVVVA